MTQALVPGGGSRQGGGLVGDECRQFLVKNPQHQITPRVEDAVDAEVKLGQVELENIVLEEREKAFPGLHFGSSFIRRNPRSS